MGDEEDLPLGALLNRLLADAQAVARAEIDVIRQTILFKLAAAQQALVLLAIALVLGLGATTALLVGLTMALAHLIGPLLATLAVVAVAAAIAALCARWAVGRLSAAMSAKPNETAQ
jgi:hypothetical protein